MTLHAAIEKLLRTTGRPMTLEEIALSLNRNKRYQKKDGSEITAFQIHGRTRKYPGMFRRNGQMVSVIGEEPVKDREESEPAFVEKQKPLFSGLSSSRSKDEKYVLDLCDKILDSKCLRQHKFDFLVGDCNFKGRAVRLPVDGYYPNLDLVVEYRERQHTEPVSFFDKVNVLTVSGVHRGEQRRIYDERRRKVLPQKGITVVEVSFSDFEYDSGKRIIRNPAHDETVIRKILNGFL